MHYKYRAINDRTMRILINRELYFAKPSELNDPLDGQIDINHHYEKARIKLARLGGEEGNRKSFLLFLLNSKRLHTKEDGKDVSLNEALQWWIQQHGILSLSRTATDPLLWSHYADGHRGICFGFDFDGFKFADQMKFHDVEYLERPRTEELFLQLVEEMGEFVRPWEKDHYYDDDVADKFYTRQVELINTATTLVKSKKWEYEQEFRVTAGGSGPQSFDPSTLRQVIFGVKTAPKDVDTIMRLLNSDDFKHVAASKVEYVRGTFEFGVVDLNTGKERGATNGADR